jgi:hypothetical protein
MPNRNLQAKHERATRQKMERAHAEYSKMGYQTARPFEADDFKPEYLPESRKVQWFDRQAKKRVAYVPSRAARRQHTFPQAVLNAWATPGEVTLYRNGEIIA